MCQPLADKPSFDIADVHVSPRSDWARNPTHALQGGYLAADRYELRRATLLDMIKIAYNIDGDKVYGGPSWLDYDRFEIVAKTKPGTRPETLRLMLQRLLADRFQLAVKADTRPLPAYLLTKGNGALKFTAAADTSSPGGCHTQIGFSDGDIHFTKLECRNVTMDAFAQSIRPRLSSPIQNLPVSNSTGLEGGWDLDLQIPLRTSESRGPANAAIIEAVEKVGLKIEMGSAPQPVLAVEHVDEQPSPNPPGVATSLPPLPPPEFEVASVKWPCNDNHSAALRFEAGGRVTGICEPLMSLIRQAWNLPLWVGPAGAPKWLADDSSTKYNISIVAKAPAGVAPDPAHNAQARDVMNAMLRKLLIDRYKMKVHFEDRPVDAQTLVAVKPKLTKADPAGRTGCARQNQHNVGRATMVDLVCRNMTMAQFAEQLQGFDSNIPYPVLDATGLQGAWDFTINYDVLASLNARFPQFSGRGTSADGQAVEPSGSLDLAQAIEKQLGLKLETHKRPQPVLVIDSMEEKPVEN